MSVVVPNIFTNPNVKAPFPPWDPTTAYKNGDCVWYGGQNYTAFGFVIQSLTLPINRRPDLFQITSNGQGIYSDTAYLGVKVNLNGGNWVSMTLATPPALPYSPLPQVPYSNGAAVMYPPGSYKYWLANKGAVFNQTPALNVSAQPNNISTGIVRAQRSSNVFINPPNWANFINSQTGVPVPFFPPVSTYETNSPPTTGVQGPTQYWSASEPLTGLPAVPEAILVL